MASAGDAEGTYGFRLAFTGAIAPVICVGAVLGATAPNGAGEKTSIRQFSESKADWLIFTIGQNTGYYNSPNAYLDAALPGRTPKRDLVPEIAERVHRMGTRFVAYLPAEVCMQRTEVQNAFGWNSDDQTTIGGHQVHIAWCSRQTSRLGGLNELRA